MHLHELEMCYYVLVEGDSVFYVCLAEAIEPTAREFVAFEAPRNAMRGGTRAESVPALDAWSHHPSRKASMAFHFVWLQTVTRCHSQDLRLIGPSGCEIGWTRAAVDSANARV